MLRYKNKLRARQTHRLGRAILELENHHSAPRYRRRAALADFPQLMSWKPWDSYYPSRESKGWKGEGKGRKDKEWKKSAKEKQTAADIIGYDGSRIPLRRFSQPSSSSLSRKPEENKLEGVAELKAALRELMPTDKVMSPALQKLLAEDPTDQIKQEQKDLNRRRKKQKKIEALQKQEATKEDAFNQWKASMKSMIKAEETRHREAMEKLREELQQAMRESEDEKEDKMQTDVSSDEEPANGAFALKKMLEDSEERCRMLTATNTDISHKMQEMMHAIYMLQAQQTAHHQKEPTPPPEAEKADGTPSNVEDPGQLKSPPMVKSPTTNSLPKAESDPMKPFRKGKPPRETPYTPKVKPNAEDNENGISDILESVETLE